MILPTTNWDTGPDVHSMMIPTKLTTQVAQILTLCPTNSMNIGIARTPTNFPMKAVELMNEARDADNAGAPVADTESPKCFVNPGIACTPPKLVVS